MPGPMPVPTPILAARGSWRAKIRQGEPTPPAGRPKCPDWLNDDQKIEWRRVTSQLAALRVLAKTDVSAIARYCVLLILFRDSGGDIETQLKVADRLLRLEQNFGLTPAARAKLATKRETPATENRGKSRFFPTATA